MKWKWTVLAVLLLPVGVVAFLNVRDYRRYRFITEIERYVTAEQFAAMARLCEVKVKGFHKEYVGAEIPPEFAVLSPVSVKKSWGCTEVRPL